MTDHFYFSPIRKNIFMNPYPSTISHLLPAFRQSFHSDPEIIIRAPGRVNLIGEHTDYNDGFVLPVAIDRYANLAASKCVSNLATIQSIDFDQTATFRITEIDPKSDRGWITDRSHWANYPAGVAWALRENRSIFTGLDAVFTSTVPIGAGLSSSAAVEVAFATAWKKLYGLDIEAAALAKLCQHAENDFVGVACGIMDQLISVLGRKDHALFVDCRSLQTEDVPLPQNVAIVVADTKVERSLASSAYNERRSQCEEATSILKRHDDSILALRDVTPAFLLAHRTELAPIVFKRARHIVTENDRVRAAVSALKRSDLIEVGRLMKASHLSLRDDYEVSCKELDAMVECAWSIEGVIGSRLTGAGFGGCTVSLVKIDQADRFVEELHHAYKKKTGIEPAIYVCNASDGAKEFMISDF
jgi:galactokinase